MNLKKILLLSLLTIPVSISLNIIACTNNQNDEDFNVIDDIDKINNLEIFITSKEETQTVFNILNNPNFGIAETIHKYQNMNKTFKKELFKLDTENIYFDINKIDIVTEKQEIIVNTIYYFQYTYNNKKNTTLVPIKITKISEKIIVKNINKIKYKQDIIVNSTIVDLKSTISSEFIKSQLDENVKKAFENNLFKLQEIKKDDQNITNDDLKEVKKIKVKILYTYKNITNQETNLLINVIK